MASMQQSGANSITLVWENAAGMPGSKDTDLAVVMILNPTKKYVASYTSAGKKADGQANFI